jgi:poly(hydroxyalkanoate) depolymerase family esterase
MRKKFTVGCCLFAAGLGLLVTLPAKAASLQLVTSNWGTNGMPTNLSMYVYVPDKLATNPPILVLLHYWGGGAGGVFAEAQGGGIVAAADRNGFIMVVPQRSADCWDSGSAQSLTHDGGGETQGIARMVRYAITNYHANAERVYVTGTSCGAMMTEALLAVYPDIFKAGSAFAGQVVGGAWTPVTHTAQQWGNIVRGAYPAYSGPRPRVQLWHGMADDIINYANQTEAIMQWTDALGLSANPTFSTTVTLYNHQWLRQIWQDSSGATALDAWSEYNGPHGTDANLNALYAMPFLNLDGVNLPYPWMSQDVGAAGVAGSATGSNGVFTVAGSGADIWNASDAFRFVYVPVNGNCTIVARVTAVQNIDPWSKAGVMIRESLNANAANAFIAVTPSNGVAWQIRSTTGVATTNSVTGALTAPYWVKLVRSGNTFSGYRSPDGTNWTLQGAATFTMSSTAYVGLALTSHNNSTLCAATFDNVTAPGWLISQGLVPAGLSATSVSASQINLVWNTLTNATSYNVKRSTTNGGPFAVIASGVTSTNFQDGGAPGGTINNNFYVVSAVVAGSETPDGAEAAVRFPKVSGAIIGSSGSYNNSGNTIANVFDNNLTTFFDGPAGNGCWAGLDFGAGVSNVITQINYCPRSGFESRMVGGIFQGANQADFSGAITLHTVTAQPAAGTFTSASVTNTAPFRYARYLSPNGGWGNVAELEFHGYAVASASSPVMSAAVAGTNLTFSWPLTNTGFTLQARTNLVSGNWINVTSPAPQMVSNQWQVALPPPGGAGPVFYRLVK